MSNCNDTMKSAFHGIKKLVHDAVQRQSKFTEDQIASAVLQAIECGDFMLYIKHSGICDGTTGEAVVTYEPYRDIRVLTDENKELRAKLDSITKILEPTT